MQAWTYDDADGIWVTWMESPAITDKREKNEAFGTAFEKWALAKFLQFVVGYICLPFSLRKYGSEKEAVPKWGYKNGSVRVGKLRAYLHYSNKTGLWTNLPGYAYDAWESGTALTEEELEQLYKYLVELREEFG